MAASPLHIMGLLLAIIVPAALLLSVVVVVLWVRQRMAIRRAGISADSPGCTKCLYLVRGWNSPVCPECGTDVREAGVATGIRLPLWMKMLAALLLTAAATIPLGELLVRAVFTYRSSIAVYMLRSPGTDGGKSFDIDLRTVTTTWKFPARTSMVTQLTLDPTASLGGINIHHQAEGWAGPVEDHPGDSAAWTTWTIEDDESLPTAEEIAAWMSRHLGVEDATTLLPHAQELATRMASSRSSAAGTTVLQGQVISITGPRPIYFSAGSGTGNSFGIAPGAAWVSIGLPALALLLVAMLVWRRHRSGWRAVHEGEWAQAPNAPFNKLSLHESVKAAESQVMP